MKLKPESLELLERIARHMDALIPEDKDMQQKVLNALVSGERQLFTPQELCNIGAGVRRGVAAVLVEDTEGWPGSMSSLGVNLVDCERVAKRKS